MFAAAVVESEATVVASEAPEATVVESEAPEGAVVESEDPKTVVESEDPGTVVAPSSVVAELPSALHSPLEQVYPIGYYG